MNPEIRPMLFMGIRGRPKLYTQNYTYTNYTIHTAQRQVVVRDRGREG